MPSMTKRVNVKASVAIRTITPPIYGNCNNIIMTTGDILKCLCKRAIVEEILPDGSTIRLNMHNYYTDNGAGLDAKKVETSKDDKKIIDEKITDVFVTDMSAITEETNGVPETPSKIAQVVETATDYINDNSNESDLTPNVTTSESFDSISTEAVAVESVDLRTDVDSFVTESAESETTSTNKKKSSKKKNSTKK